MRTLAIILLFSTFATAQISVPQEFIDSSTRAFREVVANRKLIEAQDAEMLAKSGQIDALTKYNGSLLDLVQLTKEQNQIKDRQIEAYKKMNCNKNSYFFGLWKTTRCK